MKQAYYADPHLTLHTGDALDVLAELPNDSVHCIVTSPPYWKLRDYDTATGPTAIQAAHTPLPHPPTTAETRRPACAAARSATTANTGWKATAEDYVDTLRAVFAQLRRVLVATGTVWLNLGDSYSNAAPKRADTAVHTDVLPTTPVTSLLKEPVRGANRTHILPRKNRTSHCTRDLATARSNQNTLHGRNPGDVWTIPTEANASGHPAPTPLELPIRCVAAGCPPGGTVLDPFSGSATTGLAAHRLGRNYIGIDTNPDYHIIAMQRLGMIAAGDDLSVREKSVNSTVVGEATRR